MAAELFDVELDRTFDAPVEQVWRAWTEPASVMRWWGPAGFTAPVARMDVRAGGVSLVCMRSPDGHELYNTWTYTRVDPHRALDYLLHFTDAGGTALDPAQLGLPPGIPSPVPHHVTFEAVGDDRTRVTVTESGYGSALTRDVSRAGMAQCLDKMAAIMS